LFFGPIFEKFCFTYSTHVLQNELYYIKLIQTLKSHKKKEFPEGHIDKQVYIEIYKELYSYGHPEKFAQFAFSAFDLDNNGRITFDEFILSTCFLIKDEDDLTNENRLNAIFDIFDVNHDEKIDKAEMLALYEAIFELRGETQKNAAEVVAGHFEKYDKNHDQFLSKIEFIKIFQSEDVFSVFRE
jgi:Ca2+-binding EF-hand superfamily protein